MIPIRRLTRAVVFRCLRWCADRLDTLRRTPPPFDGRVPPPDWVCFETTRYCNLQCRMCLPFLDGITVTGPHMGIETFKRYAAQVLPFASRMQLSVSGEPLMSKGLRDMVAVVQEYGLKLEMVTNGTLLNERMITLLLPVLGHVTFSYDGVTRETFEHIRAGADFERVERNMQALVAKARVLPPDRQPVMGINCTLMRANIAEFPRIVERAHELGLDFVAASHVFPVTDEMRAQSLAHDVAHATRCLDEAEEAAKRLRINLSVGALDGYIAANATPGLSERRLAASGSAAPVLGPRRVDAMPARPARDEHPPEVARRRAGGRRGTSFPAPVRKKRFPKRHAPISVCDFLWQRSYVHIEGDVRPCCVDGPPPLGNLNDASFEAVWNGPLYRAMRQRLVAQDPAPVCRGCQYIRSIDDPKYSHPWLQGQSPVPAHALPEVPVELTRPAGSALVVEQPSGTAET